MRYCFHIRGHLDLEWSEWLDGLTIVHDADGTSRLYNEVPDQAALYGLITRLRDLSLELIAATPAPLQIPEEPTAE
ncbi:MAG: hypothetical protein HGA45_04160 [Chloroflexales bacterium]|nr:hypothetical protein [Chloroflexales bacterium]